MKLFVLGLDGATFDVLNDLVREGVTPCIKELISEGASGPLKTPASWRVRSCKSARTPFIRQRLRGGRPAHRPGSHSTGCRR